MAYPALRTAKEDYNVDFQLSSASTLHQQANALERVCSDVVLGAECLSTPRIVFAKKTQKGNVKCPSFHREDSNSQRPTHMSSKHFPTIKVDFLTIKVVLRITRTITVPPGRGGLDLALFIKSKSAEAELYM